MIWWLSLLAVAVLTLPSGLAGHPASQRIYVTVVDAKGKPVTGLTAADFTVELDGAPQEILTAGPAVEPVSLILLTDRLGLNSTYTPFDVNQVLGELVKSIRKGSPDSKAALVTFDGIVLQVTKFTSAAGELDRALGRLASTAADAVLLDGLADACRMMKEAPSGRRVIFTLVAAYRPDQSNARNEIVAELLRTSGASLWTVEVRQTSGGNFGNSAREVVLDSGGQVSGGMREIVASRSGITSSTRQIAELILSQYVLTYGPATGSSTSRLKVSLKRPGARVLAPQWISR